MLLLDEVEQVAAVDARLELEPCHADLALHLRNAVRLVELLEEQDDLLRISRLRMRVANLEGGQRKRFNKQVLVDHLGFRLSRLLASGLLEEAR